MAEGTMNAERAKFEAWCDEYWDTSAYLHKSRTCGEWAAWRAAVKECVRECCEQARDEVPSITDWDKADQVVARIKEHFGVAE